MKTKIIVVTGGVYSSLGKGIIASSIGRILTEFNYNVSMQKLDPYLNVDPGTMSPYQHGEVFVTKDGAETDLDLGNYERFIDRDLSKFSSVTAGSIYYEVITNERNGKYEGKTVQVVPHIVLKIQERITNLIKKDKPDFLIIEIGGTIGDIESLPFIEALRIFSGTYGRKNLLFLHCSPILKVNANDELKTKPTQHSVKSLRNLGITPNILIMRSEKDLDDSIIQKLSWTCDIDKDNIFVSKDCKSIYSIPKMLYEQGIIKSISKYFEIRNFKKGSLTKWNKFLETVNNEKAYKSRIAITGKYSCLIDAYISVIESLKLSSYKVGVDLEIDLIDITKIKKENIVKKLSTYDGILIPGGFGERGIQEKILVAQYCREKKVPLLGICLGMQAACLDIAINVLKQKDASSEEFNKKSKYIVFNEKISSNKNFGGTLRLGNKEIRIVDNTLASKIYNKKIIEERHRHRYIFNNEKISDFEKSGIIFSGFSKNNNIVEIVEYKDHPFYIGVQFHPEFISRPNKIHPIFEKFIESIKQKK
ncbi:MAG: CTP synthase [Mycoplasmoidaceae bacterium]